MNTPAQLFAVLENLKFRHYCVINREKNIHDAMAHLVHECYKITSAISMSLVGAWNRFRDGKQ